MEWIKCSELLPEPYKIVLACEELDGDEIFVLFARYMPGQDIWMCYPPGEVGCLGDVSHWMPLPQKPC